MPSSLVKLSINCVQAVQNAWQNYVHSYTQIVCTTFSRRIGRHELPTYAVFIRFLPHSFFTYLSTVKNTRSTDVKGEFSALYTPPITITTIYI